MNFPVLKCNILTVQRHNVKKLRANDESRFIKFAFEQNIKKPRFSSSAMWYANSTNVKRQKRNVIDELHLSNLISIKRRKRTW